MQRPVIGICAALERAKWGVWDQRAVLLPIAYVNAVQRAGGLAVLFPPDELTAQDAAQTLGLIDGLLLAGGADVDAASYEQPAHPQTIDTVPERDAFEIALVQGAIELDMPVLGICRGMQILNVARGGTLVQHLPDLLGHSEHRRVPGSFEGAEHDVALTEGTLAAEAARELTHSTKSHHHQGVDRLGAGLLISGRSTLDDFPEAVELPGARFVLGVQWHPEADPSSPVVGAFVQAVASPAVSSAHE